jgi:hypothetical protein
MWAREVLSRTCGGVKALTEVKGTKVIGYPCSLVQRLSHGPLPLLPSRPSSKVGSNRSSLTAKQLNYPPQLLCKKHLARASIVPQPISCGDWCMYPQRKMTMKLLPCEQGPRRSQEPSTRVPKVNFQHLEDFPALPSSSPAMERSTTTLQAWNKLFPTTLNEEKDLGGQAGTLEANSETEIGEETGNMIMPSITSTLHKLPLELRQLCYYFAMYADQLSMGRQVIALVGSGLSESTIYLPPICRTSKVMFQESAPVYIASVTFILKRSTETLVLTRFLEYLSHDLGFKSVRSLKFESVDYGGIGEYSLELAVRCIGLRKLQLAFPVTETLRKMELSVWETMGVEAVKDMLGGYKFDQILDCGSLEELYIVGHGIVRGGNKLVMERLSGIALWIKERYADIHKRQLRVEVYWPGWPARYVCE